MTITLTKELEKVIEEQIRRGSYPNAKEAVCAAVRQTFCATLDVDQDTPELAAMLREAMNSQHTPYEKGDLQHALEKVRRK